MQNVCLSSVSTACARAQFSGCSSTTNAHSETGQTAVCCQILTLGALSSRSASSLLVGAIFKSDFLILNTPRTYSLNQVCSTCDLNFILHDGLGARGGAVVEALRYKPEGCEIDSRWCHWYFSLT
jgi:hypothetical protein